MKMVFGFDSYRKYAGEALQEKAVKATVDGKSLLAVFPTGGGKSITFQVPALMSGVSSKGLTVVISPLQSLMKDQVDNLEKAGITDAVTINGLLDPIEKAKYLERVLLMEDVKHDQPLMVTFSRSAATEFKKRLLKLVGNAANFIEIKTFHSYCFDLLGRVGTIEKSDEIIKETIRKIRNGEVETGRITKAVLVIDEA